MTDQRASKSHPARRGLAAMLLALFPLFVAPMPQLHGGEMTEPTFADIRYGVHERNVMDVWLARSVAPTPCVMIIHGGGWVQGDKRAVLGGLERYLGAGISVASINYRYLRQTMVDSGSSRGTGPVLPRRDYPEPPVREPLEDAARALQFIRHNATAWHIDPVRVAVTGGSAGAWLGPAGTRRPPWADIFT